MHRIASLTLAALLLTACNNSKPQAAEGPGAAQSVAYMVLGLEDGVGLSPNATSSAAIVHQISADPLVYRIGTDPNGLEISVTRVDDCNYSIAMESKAEKQRLGFSLDFSGLKSAVLVPSDQGMGAPPFQTSLEGSKLTCDNDKESGSFCRQFSPQRMMRYASWDQKRLTDAASHFQGNFCKPKGA